MSFRSPVGLTKNRLRRFLQIFAFQHASQTHILNCKQITWCARLLGSLKTGGSRLFLQELVWRVPRAGRVPQASLARRTDSWIEDFFTQIVFLL
jgi:hypothetical protein